MSFACCAAETYTDILIEGKQFLPVNLTLPSSTTAIKLIDMNGKLYPGK